LNVEQGEATTVAERCSGILEGINQAHEREHTRWRGDGGLENKSYLILVVFKVTRRRQRYSRIEGSNDVNGVVRWLA